MMHAGSDDVGWRESGSKSGALGNALAILKEMDWLLLGGILMLATFGIHVLSGAVAGIPALEPVVGKQMFFLCIAFAAMIAVTLIDYRWINRVALILYGLNLIALVVVLGGKSINGARSWIDLGPINWQPAETMKLATILVNAQWLSMNPGELKQWRGLIPPAFICGVPAGLILLQPDLGSASLFFLLFMTMMLVSGYSKKILAMIILATAVGAVSVYPFLKPYQKERIAVFVNPERDPRGTGYNVIQSKIAIGSGGWMGEGWGQGSQSSHRFLPEHHTDFIFASAVEQFGFAGGAFIIGCYLLIIFRLVRTMDRARDRFGGIVIGGLVAILLGHITLNAGMTMGLVPVTGIPLPLLSYGGSFLITTCLSFGAALNVATRRYLLVGL